VNDASLKELGQCPELVQLDLSNTSITDAGLAHLKTLPKLRTIRLSLTDVSDEGLAALKELPAVESIDAQMTTVTSLGVKQFRKERPKSKIEFGASDASIGRLPIGRQVLVRTTNSGVESVGISYETVKLKRLHARGTLGADGADGADGAAGTVTDDGLISLTALQSELEELDLRDSAVTDKGIITLRTLKKLKRLDLRGAPVTERGVAALARALPECEIVR
jgi:Leucine-rich repeat (LRR) protein